MVKYISNSGRGYSVGGLTYKTSMQPHDVFAVYFLSCLWFLRAKGPCALCLTMINLEIAIRRHSMLVDTLNNILGNPVYTICL